MKLEYLPPVETPAGALTENIVIQYELPYPPSTNRYYRNINFRGQGRTLISREGRAFREHVLAMLCGASGGGPRKPPMGGRIALGMDAFPPDRRRRDLDNLQKSSLDALQHAGVYEDDSQIDLLLTQRREIVPGGRIIMHVGVLPLSRCLLCGAPLTSQN